MLRFGARAETAAFFLNDFPAEREPVSCDFGVSFALATSFLSPSSTAAAAACEKAARARRLESGSPPPNKPRAREAAAFATRSFSSLSFTFGMRGAKDGASETRYLVVVLVVVRNFANPGVRAPQQTGSAPAPPLTLLHGISLSHWPAICGSCSASSKFLKKPIYR